jgi:hypothetical protein
LLKVVGVDVTKDALTPVWDKLAQLRPNIGSVGDDTVFIEAMRSGEVDFGYTLVANAPALRDAGVEVGWGQRPRGCPWPWIACTCKAPL